MRIDVSIYSHLLTVLLYSSYCCPNSSSRYFSSRLIIYSWTIKNNIGKRMIFHQFPIKQVIPKYTMVNPTYIGFLEILYMPVFWSDEAGLISITVFLLWKNCLKLLAKKKDAMINKIIPTTFITRDWNIASVIWISFWIKTEARKNKTFC